MKLEIEKQYILYDDAELHNITVQLLFILIGRRHILLSLFRHSITTLDFRKKSETKFLVKICYRPLL